MPYRQSSIYQNQPLGVTTVPNHHLYHTSDFCHAPKQFSVTIDAGLESPEPIDTQWCCYTNQCYTRSTPSHIVISVADLEVKSNFPLQQQPPVAPEKPLLISEAISAFERRQDRTL